MAKMVVLGLNCKNNYKVVKVVVVRLENYLHYRCQFNSLYLNVGSSLVQVY